MTTKNNRMLSEEELETFGRELDALRARTVATLGQRDADYIRAVYAAVHWTGFAGRLLLWGGAVAGGLLGDGLLDGALRAGPLSALIAGTLLLALAKILENMELGHNVMHGQYDWTGDPKLNGNTYEWDIVATADNWRKTHNFRHHT